MSNDFNSKFNGEVDAGSNGEDFVATSTTTFSLERMTMADIRNLVSSLSPVQVTFVKTFLESQFNLELAAQKAGLTLYEGRAALELNPNIRTICMWYMHKQAIPEEEVIARLSMMARADPGQFLKKRTRSIFNRDGLEIEKQVIWELDIQSMQERGLTFLIKKLSYTKEGIMQWEFHDSMKAIQTLMKAYGMFDQVSGFQIDWSTLNQSQVERIARGEDPRTVVMTPNALNVANPTNPANPNTRVSN